MTRGWELDRGTQHCPGEGQGIWGLVGKQRGRLEWRDSRIVSEHMEDEGGWRGVKGRMDVSFSYFRTVQIFSHAKSTNSKKI